MRTGGKTEGNDGDFEAVRETGCDRYVRGEVSPEL